MNIKFKKNSNLGIDFNIITNEYYLFTWLFKDTYNKKILKDFYNFAEITRDIIEVY